MAELDHIFLFVRNEEVARQMMADAGLRINYSRQHPGQGTTNVCACLEDMFIELLWLDGTDISAESERITLGIRGRGRGSPIGISWRGDSAFDTEPYHAPFLPEGMSLPIAAFSLDASLPFVFQSPGKTKTSARRNDLSGERQAPHFQALCECRIQVPDPTSLTCLQDRFAKLKVLQGSPAIEFDLLDFEGQISKTIRWDLDASILL